MQNANKNDKFDNFKTRINFLFDYCDIKIYKN